MKVSSEIRSLRFGPFAVDASAHQLRRNGVRAPLQEKQFRLLMTLLNRPNEVVSRAELHHVLWPEEDFGEFDVGLNQAVRRLRLALGDSAADPKWIETIPKVGYRFVGPVKTSRLRRRALAAAVVVVAVGAIVFVRLFQA